MAGPTKAVLEQMLRLEQAKRANAARGMNRAGKDFQTMNDAMAFGRLQSPLPASTDLPPDYLDLKRTAMGQGGLTDRATEGAKKLMADVKEKVQGTGWFNDLGRYSSEYDLRNKPKETMWNNPLGGYARAGLENMGMPMGQAQVGERIAAGGLSSVVGLTALAAAYDGLFGESQSPGTMPIVVSASPGQY